MEIRSAIAGLGLLLTFLAVQLPPSGLAEDAQVAPAGFHTIEFNIEGVAREALIYVPTRAKPAPLPVVFVFHGHGGSSRQAAWSFALDRHWPEAISVYMQGLPTPGRLTDPEGKRAGWQSRARDQGDRDLKFFDAVLIRLKRDFQIDEKRIYATGHSNGGAFTYLLWAERGDTFAAVAPSAAATPGLSARGLKPKPAMHLAGQQDALVKYEWQKSTMQAIQRLNQCSATGKPWAAQCTIYDSQIGAPFVTLIHPGNHRFPAGGAALIARFFQEHPAR